MKRLIRSEIKKILKNRFHQLLIVLCMISVIALTFICYHGNPDNINQIPVDGYTFENEIVSYLDYYKYADSILMKYEGEWSQEKYEMIKKESLDLMKKYAIDINEEQMIEYYGKNYKELIHKSLNHELTLQELEGELKKSGKELYDYIYDIDSNNPKYVQIHIIYGEDESHYPIDTYLWILHNASYSTLMNEGFNELRDSGIQEYHTLVSQKTGTHYFSSPVGHNIFINVLEKSLFPVVIAILVILANVYGIEKQYDMEQLVYSTKMTKQKVVQAKWIAGIILSVGLMLIAFLISFVLGNLFLPVHSFSMPVISLGTMLGGYPDFRMMINYWQLYLVIILLICVGAMAVSVVTMMVSYVFKSQFITIIILMVLLFITTIMPGASFCPPFVILNLIPQYVAGFGLVSILFGGCALGELPYVFGEVPLWIFVVGIWTLVTCVLYILITKHTHKWYVWR